MKKTILQSAVMIVLIFGTIVTVNAQKDKKDMTEVYKNKVEVLNRDLSENMISGNLDAKMTFYCQDAVSMTGNEPLLVGFEAIRKASEDKLKAGWKVLAYEPKIFKVSYSGNYVTEIGSYFIKIVSPETKPTLIEGKYVKVLELQPDKSIKIKIEIWNTDNNPASRKRP